MNKQAIKSLETIAEGIQQRIDEIEKQRTVYRDRKRKAIELAQQADRELAEGRGNPLVGKALVRNLEQKSSEAWKEYLGWMEAADKEWSKIFELQVTQEEISIEIDRIKAA